MQSIVYKVLAKKIRVPVKISEGIQYGGCHHWCMLRTCILTNCICKKYYIVTCTWEKKLNDVESYLALIAIGIILYIPRHITERFKMEQNQKHVHEFKAGKQRESWDWSKKQHGWRLMTDLEFESTKIRACTGLEGRGVTNYIN